MALLVHDPELVFYHYSDFWFEMEIRKLQIPVLILQMVTDGLWWLGTKG